MTIRIAKSAIAGLGDFAARAAAHAIEMRDWRAHMARVAEDERTGVVGIEKHMAHPRPIEHPLIDAAVSENCEMDYEIVDDGPTPEQVLRYKKDTLLQMVAITERNAIDLVIPPGRHRMLNLRENDILKADTIVFQKFVEQKSKLWNDWTARQNKKGVLRKAGEAIGIVSDDDPRPAEIDVHQETAKARSAEDTDHLVEQAKRRERIEAIARAAAQAQYDIEDLTADTIDAWQVPDLKKED